MKISKMKKSITILFVLTLMVFVTCGPVFAAVPPTTFDTVTFADSNDFTIVKRGILNLEEDIALVGVDYSQPSGQQQIAFDADEYQYITWESDSTNVVLFDAHNVWNFGYTITDTDAVTALIIGSTTANITATYNPGIGSAQSVFSYVVGEGTTTVDSVSNITMDYDGVATGTFDYPDTEADPEKPLLNVPRFRLTDIYGTGYDDADVLRNRPTALHALLYSLEIENSTETTTTPIGDFDWDWVAANVVIQSQGSYVYSIGTDEQYMDLVTYDFYGWQYRVNNADPGVSSSVTPINTNDTVKWFFAAYQF